MKWPKIIDCANDACQNLVIASQREWLVTILRSLALGHQAVLQCAGHLLE